MDHLRRPLHDALLDLAGWLRGGVNGWYGINTLHPKKVRNDNPVYGSSVLYDRDCAPHIVEVMRLLDQAPREHQRTAMDCYLQPGPRTLKGRAEKLGIPKTTLCSRRQRLLDYLLAARMDEPPRVVG